MATYQDSIIKIRVNRLEKERLQALAEREGFTSLSEFIRVTLRRSGGDVLLANTVGQ